jgi:hypothetical protein
MPPEHLQFSLIRVMEQNRPLVLPESRETLALADAYVTSRVVPFSSRDDARHVAIATVAGLDALVSWNFKHIVNLAAAVGSFSKCPTRLPPHRLGFPRRGAL